MKPKTKLFVNKILEAYHIGIMPSGGTFGIGNRQFTYISNMIPEGSKGFHRDTPYIIEYDNESNHLNKIVLDFSNIHGAVHEFGILSEDEIERWYETTLGRADALRNQIERNLL